MRRTILFALAAVAVLLLAGSLVLWQKNKTLSSDVDNARASKDAAQTQYSDALAAIAEIQDSLSTLGVNEATGPLLPGSQASEHGMSAAQERNALDRIALLKAGISRTKERIQMLEQRLHASGVHVASLEHMINNLKRAASEREEQVAMLSAQVDSLHTQVTGLTAVVSTTRDSIQTQSVALDDQRREIGTIYYVIGSKGELRREGVVDARGGVLGMGKTLLPVADASTTLFKPMDTNNESVITIPAPKARVVSAQPVSSYTLVPSGNQMELRITDPAAFRTVKRVVIMSQS